MNTRLHRVLTALPALLVAAVGGAIAGYGIGLAVTLDAAQHSLRSYATSHAAESDRYPVEAYSILKRMNASSHARCSDAELASFRQMVINAHYVRDAGRMRGQQLECSTNFSAAELPDTRYEPDFTGKQGALIYTKMESLRIGSLVPIVMRTGDFYVALDPYNRQELPQGAQFTLTMTNAPPNKSKHLGGSPTSITGDILTKNGEGRMGGNLYGTFCSPQFAACMTVELPIRDALREQRRPLMIWVGAGALLGTGFSLVCILLYRRKKGIEQQLRRAIRQDALRVVYQPLVDLATRQVVGAEALVRWTDEDKLIIPPDVFIKIAEERGFVNHITKLVLRHTLADFAKHLADNPRFRINLNVTAQDLIDPAFLPMLEQSLVRARVAPACLTIEITEGATARHPNAIATIARLRYQGHKVYIDDFGTGYSSLAYLKDLAVDGIKIDRAFTQAIGTDAVTVGILPQILAMAELLKLHVVAEGIETEAQATYYANTARPLVAQGWLFGHPISFEDFRNRWLDRPGKDIQQPPALTERPLPTPFRAPVAAPASREIEDELLSPSNR